MYTASPGWTPLIRHVPARFRVTTSPLTVQTAVVVDDNVTGSPDDENGVRTTVGTSIDCGPGSGIVIVWPAFATANDRVTAGAAAWIASPACVARMVHVPAASRLMSNSLTEQTAGVVDASVTGRPELAVGATVIGESIRVAFGGFTKVIV